MGVHLNMYSASMYDGLANLHNMVGGMFPSLIFDKVDADLIRRNPPFLNLLKESGYLHLQATKPDTVGE